MIPARLRGGGSSRPSGSWPDPGSWVLVVPLTLLSVSSFSSLSDSPLPATPGAGISLCFLPLTCCHRCLLCDVQTSSCAGPPSFTCLPKLPKHTSSLPLTQASTPSRGGRPIADERQTRAGGQPPSPAGPPCPRQPRPAPTEPPLGRGLPLYPSGEAFGPSSSSPVAGPSCGYYVIDIQGTVEGRREGLLQAIGSQGSEGRQSQHRQRRWRPRRRWFAAPVEGTWQQNPLSASFQGPSVFLPCGCQPIG